MGNPYPVEITDEQGESRLTGFADFTDPSNQPGGGSQPTLYPVNYSAKVADPANTGAFKIVLFTAPVGGAAVSMTGFLVTENFDDTMGSPGFSPVLGVPSQTPGGGIALGLTNGFTLTTGQQPLSIDSAVWLQLGGGDEIALMGFKGDGTVGTAKVWLFTLT